MLRLVHACSLRPNGSSSFGLDDLTQFCGTIACPLLIITGDTNSPDALDFVRRLRPDLGIAHGTVCPGLELVTIPRHGFIRVQRDKVRGDLGEAAELAESAQKGTAVRLTVLLAGAGGGRESILYRAFLSIELYDTPTSLKIKSNLVGNDLLVRSVADLARGKVPKQEVGPASEVWTPPVCADRRGEIVSQRSAYPVRRGRPVWKLLVRTVLFAPFLSIRNWFRRLRGSFPVIILFHHLVADRPHCMGIPTDLFLRQVVFLKKYYKIVSLSEAIELLKEGRVKVPTVVLTFDDGYKENFVNLRAVAEETGVLATLFVCTDHISSQKEFEHDLKNSQRGFLPLTWAQLRCLSRSGFEIGSHTRSHFNCGSNDSEALRLEIVGSKTDLEQHMGRTVKFFSFPWGYPANMSNVAVNLAESTYPHVFSACGGANFPSKDGQFKHLRRSGHPNDLWELELMLQSVLDF